MSAASALPAAARLPRSAAVRRVLLAGLFLAGFVALGCAFGGGAQAADGSASAKPPAGAVTPAVPQAAVKASAVEAGRELRRGGKTAAGAVAETPVGKAVRPVAERTAPAAGQAADPVTETGPDPVTEPVAGRVTEPVRDVVREVRQVADAGSLPVELPDRIPGVGGDGDTGRGDGPGEQPGQGSGPQRGTGPQHPGAGDQQGADGSNSAHCAAGWAEAGELRGASSHPVQHADSASERRPGQGHGSLPGLPGFPGLPGLPGQLPQVPASSASHIVGDGHGPRGGEQFAAVPAHSAYFGLVPGGVLAAAEPPTRQRAADILEFPG
ncbi:hypothetical protein [Streptomyces sp. NPDC045470]|uniref:hypothetical protein n=1 Tax=Streptomyces sp. NPDC045470 TaxID=3155469 RepID=UPI0034106793